MSTKEHKAHAPTKSSIGILTVSTTRSLNEDESGHWMAKAAKKEGHDIVCHRLVTDAVTAIASEVVCIIDEDRPAILLINGGTGISPKDLTIEAVQPLMHKELPAFSTLFAYLSFEQIDSAAIMSRSMAGVIGKTVVFCMPGSLKACKLACKSLIFPEVGHLVKHALEA